MFFFAESQTNNLTLLSLVYAFDKNVYFCRFEETKIDSTYLDAHFWLAPRRYQRKTRQIHVLSHTHGWMWKTLSGTNKNINFLACYDQTCVFGLKISFEWTQHFNWTDIHLFSSKRVDCFLLCAKYFEKESFFFRIRMEEKCDRIVNWNTRTLSARKIVYRNENPLFYFQIFSPIAPWFFWIDGSIYFQFANNAHFLLNWFQFSRKNKCN